MLKLPLIRHNVSQILIAERAPIKKKVLKINHKTKGNGQMSKKDYKRFTSEKLRFLSLDDGQSVIAKFISAEIVPSHFNKFEIESFRYNLVIDGIKKILESNSGNLADKMSEISPDAMIKIKRINNTQYKIINIEE